MKLEDLLPHSRKSETQSQICNVIPFYDKWIKSTPSQTILLRLTVLLLHHLHLSLLSRLLASGLPTKFWMHLVSLVCVSCFACLIQTWEKQYKLRSASLCNYLLPVTSSLTGTNTRSETPLTHDQ
jgi:hypothetical protein